MQKSKSEKLNSSTPERSAGQKNVVQTAFEESCRSLWEFKAFKQVLRYLAELRCKQPCSSRFGTNKKNFEQIILELDESLNHMKANMVKSHQGSIENIVEFLMSILKCNCNKISTKACSTTLETLFASDKIFQLLERWQKNWLLYSSRVSGRILSWNWLHLFSWVKAGFV